MKKNNVNSEVLYETSNNNLKTTDPQVDYQVNAAENSNAFFIGKLGTGRECPSILVSDEELASKLNAAKNNLVIGEMGKGRAYHLDEGKVEQFANPDEVQKLQEFAQDMYRLSKRHQKPVE